VHLQPLGHLSGQAIHPWIASEYLEATTESSDFLQNGDLRPKLSRSLMVAGAHVIFLYAVLNHLTFYNRLDFTSQKHSKDPRAIKIQGRLEW
jgi:hypothetical protein